MLAFHQNIKQTLLNKQDPAIQYTIEYKIGNKCLNFWNINVTTQPAFTCSKLTIETLEQGVKYVQS